MKQITRKGKTVTVFDSVEELKWFYHRRLCKNSSDSVAQAMIRVSNSNDIEKANQHLKLLQESCEVKK